MKILLIEDNEMNRDMLSRRLQRKGYEVVCADDGESGIAAAHREKPALILMDMSLPVLDGWEAARRLKADAEMASTPIVALTAHAMATDREKALEAGCDDYDTKPVELPRLLQKMEALLRGSQTSNQSSSPSSNQSSGAHETSAPGVADGIAVGETMS